MRWVGRTTTVRMVQSTSGFEDQITRTTYDALGRVIKSERDAGDSGVDTNPGTVLGTLALSNLKTTREITYDEDSVGDSHVSRTIAHHTSAKNTETKFHRTWRGHVRGIERIYDDGTSTADVKPYHAMDVDWMGRRTASAQYTTEPTWQTDYDSHVVDSVDEPSASGHNNVVVTKYDKLGRVYQTLRYPGTEDKKHFEVNSYYDRNGRLVCTGDKYSVHTEYAYDGVGRQYQVRTVKGAPATNAYSGTHGGTGGFDYVVART